ncbi:MAG: ion transporter [Bacteroidetes bacterium]|nr:ion transporter [Bacteroidota bacterium]
MNREKSTKEQIPDGKLRSRLYDIIVEADTPLGKAFDEVLIATIILSIVVVMLDSVASYRAQYPSFLRTAEWMFTILFTAEYFLRLACVDKPARYARSFFGVIDLLAVIPTYLSVLVPGAQFLLVIRLLRILRVFRVLKLAAYLVEAEILVAALRDSRRKILIFMFAVLTLTVILGALMYLIEGDANGFTSIPRGVYWAIVTLTTVGYGDISPQTDIGQAFASLIMILGYGIIAVPTGIVTAEMTRQAIGRKQQGGSQDTCPRCGLEPHDVDARYCKRCGEALHQRAESESLI